MADFVAVLRKAISNLGENTPEMREKVYDKARATIEAKLAAINPPPPPAVADRQRKALEDAIAVVRADYAEKEATVEDDELEDIFASLHQEPDIAPAPPVVPQPAPRPAPAPAPVVTAAPHADPAPAPVEPPAPSAFAPEAPQPAADSDEPRPPITDGIDTLLDSAPSRDRQPHERRAAAASVRARGGSGKRVGLAAAIVVLLAAAAGAGYFFLSDDGTEVVTESPDPVAQTGAEQPASTAEELTEEQPQEQAAATPEQPATPAEPGTEKFTQRLLPDGSEVDEGPAGEKPSIGEGTSVATLQQPANAQPAQNGSSATPANTAEQPAAQQQSGVVVGQRAIFYEERTSSAQGSAELGNIAWSIVQESPGGDLPPEPTIRAEATIPGKDVQLRMTIRRNGDATLPASHIVEMIFLTPEGFEGGAISNVSRMSFKETEQAAGSPLIGIPAKIADGFFLIALGDAPAEIQTNMNLLRQQSWIDIPIVYQTGRRALLSLEKGIPGDKVFQEALQAWEQANAG